jgi:transcriptional regulator GlxA family with amidase domain
MSLTAAFPLYPGFDTLDVMGPLQAFLYAGITSTLLAEDCGGVTSLESITVQATEAFDTETRYDILFVPGGNDIPSVLQLGRRGANPYLNFLTRQAESAKLVCSVCTGALLLGAAGLLDNHTATTHWAYKDVLRLFPCNVVDDYRRYVQSGNVVTGGGISSGIDEALYIIATTVGLEGARRAQLAMQYHPQPIVHCGDPSQPDIRDIPELPASIQSDWYVSATTEKVRQWLTPQAAGMNC